LVDYLGDGVAHSLWLAQEEAPLRLSFPAGLRSGVRCVDGLLPPRAATTRALPRAWRRKSQSCEAAPAGAPSSSATALAISAALPASHSRNATCRPPSRHDSVLPPRSDGAADGVPSPSDVSALTSWANFVSGLAPGQRVCVKKDTGE
jgi:hypothetical protein